VRKSGLDTLAATGDIGQALDAMEAVTAQVDFASEAARLAALGIDINNPFAGSFAGPFAGSYQLPVLPTEVAQAAEELAAPVAGDPTRAALYGDAGYGEGLTGAQTQAFDDTLAATGDVGQALVAMETVAAPAPAPAPAPSFGFTSFGGFGRRGGFSGLGRGRSAAPPPAPAPAPALLRHPRPLRPLKKRVLLERRVWRKKRRRCRKMWRQRSRKLH
jgi:hypothetical protein